MNSVVKVREPEPWPLGLFGARNSLWSRPEFPERPAGVQRAHGGRTAGGSDRPISAFSMWIVTA